MKFSFTVKHGRNISSIWDKYFSLSLLEENQLCAKMTKCSLDKEEVDYLGHAISKEGAKVDLTKIKAITEWLKVNNISKLRGFLGLTGHYQRFI